MNRKESFEIIKKLNIIKGYLLIADADNNLALSLISELFENDETNEIKNIKSELVNGKLLLSLNFLNNYKENISKSLFKNPCSKQWYELVDTDNYKTKYCLDCKKNVYLVSNEEELIKRRNLEQCVAVNSLEVFIKKENDKNFKACHIKFEEEFELGLPA